MSASREITQPDSAQVVAPPMIGRRGPAPAGHVPAAALGLATASLVVSLLYYWFAVADRYAVFLYGHLGATPFDSITSSRYWMAGLVAGGAAMSLVVGLSWLAGRLRPGFVPSSWFQSWIWAAAATVPSSVAIVMLGAEPRLPATSAAAVAVTSAAGLALALLPARVAARAPAALAWRAAYGAALAPCLLLMRVVELPGRLPSVTPLTAAAVVGGSIAASTAALAVLGALGRPLGQPAPAPAVILASACAIAYLALPLIHHLAATPPGFRYITASANFFAEDWRIQGATWLAASLPALAANRLGRRL